MSPPAWDMHWGFSNDPAGTGRGKETGKSINVAKYSKKPDATQKDYAVEWLDFRKNWDGAIKNGTGTIVVDTATEMYELIRLAYFGKLTQVMPHHYGPVNAEMKEMIRMAYDTNMSVIFLHKMRKAYQDDKWTGGYEPAGWADMPFQVQANIEIWRDDAPITSGQWKRGKGGDLSADGLSWVYPFHVFIKDCNINMEMTGTDHTADLFGFDTFLKECYK